MREVDSCDGQDPECGFPKRVEVVSAANLVMRDLAGGVVPAWSRYTQSALFVRFAA